MYDPELDRFKSDIHFVQYAVERYGYERDRRESSRASHVLRHPGTDDKIVVRKAEGGHWTYFSVRDDRDNGTIIDFVHARGRHASLGHVRQELREWLGTPRPEPDYLPPAAAAPRPHPGALEAAFAAARTAESSPYLNARGVRPETLRDPRFAGRWGVDERGNTLFVHTTDTGQVTGYEIKSRTFTGFSTGGTKSAWQSVALPTDRALIVTESAIDALSYYQLHPAPAACARFLSTAGAPSPHQFEQVARIFAQLPPGCAVVAAVDSDPPGDKLASRIEEIARGNPAIGYQRHSPTPAKDWNDVLQRVEREYIRAVLGLGRSASGLERGR
jgi:hypothetical protein